MNLIDVPQLVRRSGDKFAICPNCNSESKLRERGFSSMAWDILLSWEEIPAQAFRQPICDSCYDDLREVLIDRQDELPSLARVDQSSGIAS